MTDVRNMFSRWSESFCSGKLAWFKIHTWEKSGTRGLHKTNLLALLRKSIPKFFRTFAQSRLHGRLVDLLPSNHAEHG